LRQRIAYERDQRGWSRTELSNRLSIVGCDLKEQDLYNIESPPPGRPPRVVKVDELAALAEVFEMQIPNLLTAPSTYLSGKAARIVEEMGERRIELVKAYKELDALFKQAFMLMPNDPDLVRLVASCARLEGAVADVIDAVLSAEVALEAGARPAVRRRG